MNPERRVRRLSGTLLVMLALALAACGRSPAGAVAPPAPAGAATAVATTNAATGDVVLAPGNSHFATSAAVTITVRNNAQHAIYVLPHATACTIIALQRLDGGNWRQVFPCVNGYPHPFVQRIAAGDTVAVRVTPTTVGGGGDQGGGGRWTAGTYRATLTYTTSVSAAYGDGTTAYSQTFTVG